MRYPVGIQTFSEIREEGYFYVDKTASVYKLVKSNKYVFLSRPRRFGKSLLVSTLQSYFEGKKTLFEGLAIYDLEKEWKSYPVLRFDLSGASYSGVETIRDKLIEYISFYEKKYGLSEKDRSLDLGIRFFSLITGVATSTGKQVVVLVDEYDKPLIDSLHDAELNSVLKNELRGFYGVLKQSDEYIKFGMLTGITKFGKINIFSGLNNLTDITLDPRYNTVCGISETEFRNSFQESVAEFSKVRNIPEEQVWTLFKDNYDGYMFSEYGEGIYNPFCVLLAFDKKKIRNYWYESGSPTHLIKILETNHFDLSQLKHPVRTASQLNNIGSMKQDLVPLLYQAGYLTIKGYDEEFDEYTLGIPNLEVYRSFWNSLINHFFQPETTPRLFAIENFRDSLSKGDIEGFLRRLKSLMADTNSEYEPNKEIHFQNMFAIFVKLLGYIAQAESHSSRGRCDLTVETPNFIYIFEFKVNSTPADALAQIIEKGYAERFEADPRQKILAGVNFSTEKRTIDGWKISTIE
ncbi:MAG: ATP-binding protein [Muribaculaceae bacterium]|nr:ATP-binding protein [Muribaculaceae bacterium]